METGKNHGPINGMKLLLITKGHFEWMYRHVHLPVKFMEIFYNNSLLYLGKRSRIKVYKIIFS